MTDDERNNVEIRSDPLSGFWITAIPSILHFFLAGSFVYLTNVWADEGSTLYTTSSFGHAIRFALADEKQAPLYFWILGLWREIDGSIFYARLPSLIFSVVAVRVFLSVARKFLTSQQAYVLTLLFAAHPFLVWASAEIRVYSLVILLSLLLILVWHRAYFESGDKRIPRSQTYLFLGLAVFSLYTNYYLGFVLAGLFAALLAAGKGRSAIAYFLNMIAAGVAFAPLLLTVRAQFAANTVAFQTPRSIIEGLRILWNTVLTFALPTEMFPAEEISTISIARVWIARFVIIVLIVLIFRKRREIVSDERLRALTALVATIGLLFFVAYLALGEAYVASRHASVLFAPFLILLTTLLWRGVPKLAVAAVALTMLAFYSYSIFTMYPWFTKRGDWRRVAEFVEESERPGQPIVVFTTFDVLALRAHYHGVNPILPDEKFFDWEIEAPAGTPDAWRRQTGFIVSEIPPEAREIWLLTNEKCEIGESCAPLEKFVGENYTVVEEHKFYLEKARLLRKKE